MNLIQIDVIGLLEKQDLVFLSDGRVLAHHCTEAEQPLSENASPS